VVHKCKNCGHDNKDLEPDEDGDLVCEECGYTIPEEEDALAAVDNEVRTVQCFEHKMNSMESQLLIS
jgi:transcription initiation factor TFIIIB Brf1 subunit/transcription initiation factor TFIIB